MTYFHVGRHEVTEKHSTDAAHATSCLSHCSACSTVHKWSMKQK